MTIQTRPFWLTLATTESLHVAGVSLQPWQAKAMMAIIDEHHKALDKNEPLVSGWSLRHVREPVVGAWQLSLHLGMDRDSPHLETASEIDRRAKLSEALDAWQWSHVERDRRSTCASPYSACVLARPEDSALIEGLTKEWFRVFAWSHRDLPRDYRFGCAACVELESRMVFTDIAGALGNIQSEVLSKSPGADCARIVHLRSAIEKWEIEQQTCVAPAIAPSIRL